MKESRRFYTYTYLREDGTPYYIGKGSGYRAYTNGGRPCYTPNKERIVILKKDLLEEEAFKHEMYMIFLFGRKDIKTGILYNKSDGGEKCRTGGVGNFREGTKHTEETKKLIGSYHKNKILASETKEKLRKANKGKKWWHNGVESKHTFECPGAEWQPGRITKRTRRKPQIGHV